MKNDTKSIYYSRFGIVLKVKYLHVGGFGMSPNQLRIEQYETVLYDANLNPLGIPASVKQSIANNIGSIIKYPDIYYANLKTAIADYAGTTLERIIMGNGSPDLLRLFAALLTPERRLWPQIRTARTPKHTRKLHKKLFSESANS